MKAWIVGEKDSFYSTVVFAETRGKARSTALCTDCCEDANFCDIEVRRLPKADKLYKKGKTEMDWYDAKDRIFLVKECGFVCEYVDIEFCIDCPANKYCGDYKTLKEWESENKDG